MRVSPRRTAIARARLKAGMLQKEFADHCGVSVSHMRKVELGKRKSATIAAKAKALRRQKT